MQTVSNEQTALIDQWLTIMYEVGGEVSLKNEYRQRTGIDPTDHRDQKFNEIMALLQNHGLVHTADRSGFDKGYMLSHFGESIVKAGGWRKYFTTIEDDNTLAREIAASTLVLNQKVYPRQLMLTYVLITFSAIQSIIFYLQFNVMNEQLEIQRQSQKQQHPPSPPPILSHPQSTPKPVIPEQKSDSSLTQ